MRRDQALAALGTAGRAVRERARAALRAVTGPAAHDRARRAWAALRRRPDVILVAGLVVGVVVMILHWS
jgi:hypothetical protein